MRCPRQVELLRTGPPTLAPTTSATIAPSPLPSATPTPPPSAPPTPLPSAPPTDAPGLAKPALLEIPVGARGGGVLCSAAAWADGQGFRGATRGVMMCAALPPHCCRRRRRRRAATVQTVPSLRVSRAEQ
jgi:hypothetical protein